MIAVICTFPELHDKRKKSKMEEGDRTIVIGRKGHSRISIGLGPRRDFGFDIGIDHHEYPIFTFEGVF